MMFITIKVASSGSTSISKSFKDKWWPRLEIWQAWWLIPLLVDQCGFMGRVITYYYYTYSFNECAEYTSTPRDIVSGCLPVN